ncbi:MAG: 1-deoxy-D-xylulose-5-phosphate synthase [Nitrospirales bacterium]|nr:MAG: 1-deoxy-D-xylulose-5-phosphate synthase [Nitrospirales bacterium]
MRNAFAETVTQLAEDDTRLVLLTGDIGNHLFDTFQDRYPNRFVNCGVAEANMIGVAGGLALAGMKPLTYTIASFSTTRCLEQIRVDLCYHRASVVIVGVGAGLAYAANGATHHACEDIALLKALPEMTVVCPGDPWEVQELVRAAVAHDGPVYIRLGKKGEPVVHTDQPKMTIGKSLIVKPGRDVCLISTGNVLPVAMEAAALLQRRNVSTQVVSMHTVKPLEQEFLRETFSKFPTVVTVEEHSCKGGLGGSIAEWQVERQLLGTQLICIGTDDVFLHEAGGHEFARDYFGLTPHKIMNVVLSRTCKKQNAKQLELVR